jgi:hypothetical protein
MVNQRFVKAGLVVIFLLRLGAVLHQRRERRLIVKKSVAVKQVVSLLQTPEQRKALDEQ